VLIFASTIHVLLCVFMIFVILLQPGKDAGMGSALGGGAATSAFGGRGAVTFLGKVTAVCAIGFFLTSLGLSFVGMRSSVAEGLTAEPAPVNVKKEEPKKAEQKQEVPPTGMQQGAPATEVPPSTVPTPQPTAPAGPQ
jgi:preprotein translocase subunit SecG